METEPLEELARKLTPAARELLLMNGALLERENNRTRAFIDRFRLPNPARLLHAAKNRPTILEEEPDGRGLSDEAYGTIRALHFFPAGVREHDGLRSERWIAPDGFVVLSCSHYRRFLSVVFDDDHRISMWPDVNEAAQEAFDTTIFMESSNSLFDDYRRILERAAEYMRQTDARPLYRYQSPELDLACDEYYDRYQAAWGYVKLAHTERLSRWMARGISEAAEEMEWSGDEGRKMVQAMGSCAPADLDAATVECRSCSASTRVAFAKFADLVHCSSCHKRLPITDHALDAGNSDSVDRLRSDCPLPVLVLFWDPTSGPNIFGMTGVIDAAMRSDGRFVLLRVDSDALAQVAREHDVSTFPTLVRFDGQDETGRLVGPQESARILQFAT